MRCSGVGQAAEMNVHGAEEFHAVSCRHSLMSVVRLEVVVICG